MQILDAFRAIDYHGMPAVLVASHGPFTWGKDAAEAVYHRFILDYVAEMTDARPGEISNPRVKGIRQSLLDKHFLRQARKRTPIMARGAVMGKDEGRRGRLRHYQ